MQIYILSEPIYGPESYTNVGKKIDTSIVNEPEKVLDGGGLDDENPSSSDNKVENTNEKIEENQILNELNQKTKGKLDGEIYKSFLHPNPIKTGSITLGVGVKRKISPTINEISSSNESKKKSSVENAKVKHKFHLI